MTHTLVPLLVLLACPLLASAEEPKERRFVDHGSADKRLAGYETPEGLNLEIVSEDAVVDDPIALAFGTDGTPYVLEGSRKKCVVKALAASKPGGPWDESRVVLEVEWASGMLFHDGRLYLVSRGEVRRYKPSKTGGKFDEGQLVAKGFGKVGGVGLAIGPDGWLHISAEADIGRVEGSDGSRDPVYRTGSVFRCRPDGKRLHALATGTGIRSASWELGFDVAGHVFAANGPHLLHVSDGSDVGKLPRLTTSKAGSFAGVVVYNDTLLPAAYRGLLYTVEPTSRVVRVYGLEQSGATFGVGKSFDLVRAPKDVAFQPNQLVVGPDGAFYLVDRRRGEKNGGRIYRISGAKAESPKRDRFAKMVEESEESLLKSLSGEDATRRSAAQTEFIRRGDKNRKALLDLLLRNDGPALGKLAAVGALQTMFDADVQKAFLNVLDDGDDELRRAVAEALGLSAKRGDADVNDGLLKALVAEDNDLRRAVAIAMARVAGPGAGGNLAATLAADDGKDRVLHDGLVRALEMLGKPGIDALVSIADSGVQKDTDRVATTFLGLRTVAAFDAVPRLLKNPHLSTAQRVALVESAPNYRFDVPPSFEAVVAAVAANAKESDEVRVAVLQALVTCGAATGPQTAAFIVAQLGNNNLDVRAAALKAASTLRVTAASGVLVKALAGELSSQERLATVEALRHAGVKEKEVWEAVRRQMRDGSPALKREGLRTLAALHPATAIAEAEAYLLHEDAALRREAVVVSGLSAAGAKRVGKLWQEGKLPKALRAAVVATLTAWAKEDAECAKLLGAIAKE